MANEMKVTVPTQFYTTPSLKTRVMGKVRDSGVPLSKFLVMAMEELSERPIKDSVRRLHRHNMIRRKRK